MSNNKWFWLVVAVILIAAFVYNRQELAAPQAAAFTPKIVMVVGGKTDPFWRRVANGAKKSAAVHGANLEVIVPEDGGADQTKHLLTINPDEYDGVAVSPMEPEKQTMPISVLATRTKVVTFDNDAPDSVRHCYVGTNNYVSGMQCGQLVKEALPEGGKIALFVGDHERENSQLRRQGVIDALKGGNRRPGEDLDPIDEPVEAGPYTIVATYLDGGLNKAAKENAKQAIQEHPDLDCMVGLYGHNAPMCLKAIEEMGKLDDVSIVAFDEHEDTLTGIEAGRIYGTVVQEPYQYGFETVRILVALSQEDSFQPYAGRGSIYLPCLTVKADNLAELRGKLKSQQSDPAK